MSHSGSWGLALLALVLASPGCANPQAAAPPRPASVPPGGQWAGGSDGGAWIRCVAAPQSDRYRCETFFASGNRWTTGDYVLRARYVADGEIRYRNPADRPELRYVLFDGVVIHLQSPLLLLPDGRIENHVDGQQSKFETFNEGRQLDAAEEEAGSTRGGFSVRSDEDFSGLPGGRPIVLSDMHGICSTRFLPGVRTIDYHSDFMHYSVALDSRSVIGSIRGGFGEVAPEDMAGFSRRRMRSRSADWTLIYGVRAGRIVVMRESVAGTSATIVIERDDRGVVKESLAMLDAMRPCAVEVAND